MIKAVCRFVTVCGCLLAISSPAQADPFTLTGGTPDTIPGGVEANAFIGASPLFPGPLIGGFLGAQIEFNIPLPSTLLFEFYGAEATFDNSFEFNGSPVPGFVNTGAPITGSPLASFSTSFSGTGVLPFQFLIDGGPGFVANGSNPNASGASFFATCDPSGSAPGSGGTTCSSVYLFLDDAGVIDDNHDDLLVRISVPEPATLALLGVGLIGLVGRRLRRSRSGNLSSTPSV